jgi:hypothetical protein
MKPTLRPFGDGKDWAGLYLSCRQARDELEDVATTQFNVYIDKIKQEIASKPNAKLRITYTKDFKTMYLRGNIPAVSGIDKLSRLAELHVNGLSINFKLDGDSLSDEDNIANKHAITQALSNVAYFFDCQQRGSPIYRAYFPPKSISIGYDLEASASRGVNANFHRFKLDHQNSSPKAVARYSEELYLPLYLTIDSDNGNYAFRKLVLPGGTTRKAWRSVINLDWMVEPCRARRFNPPHCIVEKHQIINHNRPVEESLKQPLETLLREMKRKQTEELVVGGIVLLAMAGYAYYVFS